MGYWGIGVLGYWGIGVLEYWGIGARGTGHGVSRIGYVLYSLGCGLWVVGIGYMDRNATRGLIGGGGGGLEFFRAFCLCACACELLLRQLEFLLKLERLLSREERE